MKNRDMDEEVEVVIKMKLGQAYSLCTLWEVILENKNDPEFMKYFEARFLANSLRSGVEVNQSGFSNRQFVLSAVFQATIVIVDAVEKRLRVSSTSCPLWITGFNLLRKKEK